MNFICDCARLQYILYIYVYIIINKFTKSAMLAWIINLLPLQFCFGLSVVVVVVVCFINTFLVTFKFIWNNSIGFCLIFFFNFIFYFKTILVLWFAVLLLYGVQRLLNIYQLLIFWSQCALGRFMIFITHSSFLLLCQHHHLPHL